MKLRYKVLLVWIVFGLAYSMFLDSRVNAQPAKVQTVTLRTLGIVPGPTPQSPPTVTAELGFEYGFPALVAKYRIYDRGTDLSCQGPRALLAETATGTPPTDSFPRQTTDPSDDPIPLQITFSAHCLEIVAVSASGAEGGPLTFPFAEPPLPAPKNPKLWRVTF
ncbi:MAG: hypothetical protein C4523_12655 [Myxococcales bacterium]|nr:MAG: hypothetical protein C4523_12655 [Myxococcales bacterium]